jgi:hypothetical protein
MYENVKKTNIHVVTFSHAEQCHENRQTSLIMNLHVEYVVVKSFIQLLRDNSLTGIFLGESPHHLHTLLGVAPSHVPHVQPIQGATLSVSGFGLRDSAGVLAGNLVEASGGNNTWIHWASE